MEHLADGDYLVDGAMAVGDINELLGTHLPDDDWDTLAGFVFNVLGHVPVPGDFVDHNGWRFSAEQMIGRRIGIVRISAIAPTG